MTATYRYSYFDEYSAKQGLPAGDKSGAVQLIESENISSGSRDFTNTYGTLSSIEADLLHLAAVVFASDRASERGEREDICREIELSIRVHNAGILVSKRREIERLLRLLSNDAWRIQFIQIENGSGDYIKDAQTTAADVKGRTLLFSGGLDSLAAAVEYSSKDSSLLLVSHKTHNPVTDLAQRQLAEMLLKDGRQIVHHQFFVSSRDDDDGLEHAVEVTQRTRSFVFLTLGALAARRSGHHELVYMAENGQMAIHLPLSAGRIGAFSTHTAHPEVLRRAAQYFTSLLNHSIQITNPYVYRTKAEVVAPIVAYSAEAVRLSTSCWKNSRVGASGITHCGICVPCLIRRISLEIHGKDPTKYARHFFDENIAVLGDGDDGRRNICELAEFVSIFSTAGNDQIFSTFPELYSSDYDSQQVIAMYRRFANEAIAVFGKYPTLAKLVN